jgi:hypothetical protein
MIEIESTYDHIFFVMATLYSILSNSLRKGINSFYRRCLRIICYLFECLTIDPHNRFLSPTLEEIFRKDLVKRLNNIQQHEQELIACYLMNKTVMNTTHHHYKEKPYIQSLSRSRPSTQMTKF